MIFKRNDDGIWQSISDMMTGLMMIFLFVCMGFLFQMKETVNRYEQIKNQIHQDLIDEFKPEDMARLGAKIEEDDLRIIFVSPSVFFAAGDSTVNPNFQAVLAEFFPRYMKVLEKYSAEIVEVRIEGNASPEWSGDVNSNEAYFYNMKLSQDRAFNVLQRLHAQRLADARKAAVARRQTQGERRVLQQGGHSECDGLALCGNQHSAERGEGAEQNQ
ncbi:MAG: OmpA family protein [Selenomonadaceae bacterium]|nr:OmpA family protein [Selenomonadaceae bacterium]